MKKIVIILSFSLFIGPIDKLHAYSSKEFIATLKNSRKVQIGLGVSSALLVLGLYFYKKSKKKSQPRNPWKPLPKPDVHNLDNDKGINPNSDGSASAADVTEAQRAIFACREDFDVTAPDASVGSVLIDEYDEPHKQNYDSTHDEAALDYHAANGDW